MTQLLVRPVVLIVVLKIYQKNTVTNSNKKIQRKNTIEYLLKISTNKKGVNRSRIPIFMFLV